MHTPRFVLESVTFVWYKFSHGFGGNDIDKSNLPSYKSVPIYSKILFGTISTNCVSN